MKRLMAVLFALIIFIAGCGLLPPTPDANNGLVKIRIPNPRMQQAGYELSAIPQDTETIGVRVEGPNPALVQVKSFGNSPYIEFSFLLPAPGNYKFYIIGANVDKVLNCYGIKQASIQPGIANEIPITLQTYSTSLTLESNTKTEKFKEPQYSTPQPREVIWSENNYLLEFSGDGIGALYYNLAWNSYKYHYAFTKYTTDSWSNKSFWLNVSKYEWTTSPKDTQRFYIRRNDDNSIRVYSDHYLNPPVSVYVPLLLVEENEPYNFTSGNIVISVPVVWEKFNNMEAGFLLTPINMRDLIGDTVIIVQ